MTDAEIEKVYAAGLADSHVMALRAVYIAGFADGIRAVPVAPAADQVTPPAPDPVPPLEAEIEAEAKDWDRPDPAKRKRK